MRTETRETPTAPVAPPAAPKDELPGKRPVHSAPVERSTEAPSEVPVNPTATETISLLPEDAANRFRSRWESIQSGFVDDPHHSVEQAAALVDEALKQLNTIFDEKRARLEREGKLPTEDLRQTLRHYRLLLNRLF